MKGIIIASHGEMANGILDTSRLFFGEQPQLKAFCIHEGEDADAFKDQIAAGIKEVDSGDGVIVLCDMLFGTPCNCCARLLGEGMDFEVITGVNLAMVLQVLATREAGDVSTEDLINQGIDGIKDLKKVLSASSEDEDE